MAQVNFPFSDLRELLSVKKEWAMETLTMLGFPAEVTETGELSVEVTPNRPDCLCVEGLARTLRCYMTGRPAKFIVSGVKVAVTVDKTVSDVRPFFGAAVVHDIKMTESFLRSLMQVQEKLHETLGRKRKKVAIGIHDMDRVEMPFRYFACGRKDISFVPLEMEKKMTPEEILQKHPKGTEYAHLVGKLCPMITDRNGFVLSSPPIINGELTKLTLKTRNLFIDCTGTSETAVRQAVNILCAMLSERGGKIEEAKINGKPYDLLLETKWVLPLKKTEQLLGTRMGSAKLKGLLAKMGFRPSGNAIFAPGYRADVIDEVDLIEDAAIAFGFNNFEPSFPEFSSFGSSSAEKPLHELLVGLGYDEVMTWTLSNRELERKACLPASRHVEIENPLTEDFTIFRPSLLPNLLAVLSESRNEKLPIRIYEAGPVAAPALEDSVCMASMHARASFSEIKGAVLSLAEALGRKAEIKAKDFPCFIPGRCAELLLDGKPCGFFGEISPEVLSNFSLEQPVCAAVLKGA